MTKHLSEERGVDWSGMVRQAMGILSEESSLQEIVRLVGVDALSESDRLTLVVARMLREDYLQQNAFDDVDTTTSDEKQTKMLSVILHFSEKARKAMDVGAYYDEILEGTKEVREKISRMKYIHEDDIEEFDTILSDIDEQIGATIQKGGQE